MRPFAPSLLALAAFAGCGDESKSKAGVTPPAATTASTVAQAPVAAEPAATGTQIVTRPSQFGRMLFDSRPQAIYIFTKDRRNRTTCYGACAKAWPPVLTKGKPRARKGTKGSLLGTIKRRDGKRHVTYNGKPLYFYAHEGKGQVLCHNVPSFGGLWFVIGPDGKQRPA
jgi:predicted lipoprotein with Yx(FWY)xxD motif